MAKINTRTSSTIKTVNEKSQLIKLSSPRFQVPIPGEIFSAMGDLPAFVQPSRRSLPFDSTNREYYPATHDKSVNIVRTYIFSRKGVQGYNYWMQVFLVLTIPSNCPKTCPQSGLLEVVASIISIS